MTNPAAPASTITVLQPQGSAATPFTGGTCGDASRPVAIVVHGWLASDVNLYRGIVDHLVSQGNIVVFGAYANSIADVPGSANNADAQIAYAGTRLGARADLDRLGLVGHSLGGGILPSLTQRAVARGWGGTALWLVPLAPYSALPAGTAPISLPAHAHAVVEAYDGDTLVDAQVGRSMYDRMAVPARQKWHVTVRSSSNGGSQLNATHTTPNSAIAPDDAVKYFGIYRVLDALESCSLTGRRCRTDLSYMGVWDDGTAVLPSVVLGGPAPK